MVIVLCTQKEDHMSIVRVKISYLITQDTMKL